MSSKCLVVKVPCCQSALSSKCLVVNAPCHALSSKRLVVKAPCRQSTLSSKRLVVKAPCRQSALSSKLLVVKAPCRQSTLSSQCLVIVKAPCRALSSKCLVIKLPWRQSSLLKCPVVCWPHGGNQKFVPFTGLKISNNIFYYLVTFVSYDLYSAFISSVFEFRRLFKCTCTSSR